MRQIQHPSKPEIAKPGFGNRDSVFVVRNESRVGNTESRVPILESDARAPTFAMNQGEVHIWKADLDIGAASLADLFKTLSVEERARSERFRFSRDRRRFIARRGYLRAIIGRYLGMVPDQVRLCYAPAGKPFLASECGGDQLSFNMSHSGELAVYAFAQSATSRNIGIDVERIDPGIAQERIAEHFFSSYEIATLRALPDRAQPQGFFNCWTRKEAYVKAIGDGLALPLDQFDVSLIPGEPAALLRIAGDDASTSGWCIQELPVGPGFVGALAIKSA